MKNQITPRGEDYSQWYSDVVEAADLAEISIVRGCMVIKPNGYAIWEMMRDYLDKEFKETGHKNAYFPLFIPKSLLSREASHVKGFAKECAVVTHHRLIESPDGKGVIVDPDAKLEEELIVRPTSETIMYDTYKRWIHSWRDLPILINQWNNVVRWEMRTRIFLRTSEFLWQEGHTAHATENEARDEVLKILNIYKNFSESVLAIPAIVGHKSQNEKFAGASDTYTVEILSQEGKATQFGTSHMLGQNFSKAFDITFADKDGQLKNVWQTSWGVSTRMIGALIMAHSDDKGLVLPPRIAPTEIVIVPIFKEENKATVLEYANTLFSELKNEGFRVELDDRDYISPGAKFNEWEKKGIPLRIEVGPKDIESNKLIFVRRDNALKESINRLEICTKAKDVLNDIQNSLYEKALLFRESNSHVADTYDDFKMLVEHKKGFIHAYWCEDPDCEEHIKEDTKATTRCLPLDSAKDKPGKCVRCGKDAKNKWVFAIAY